MPYQAAWDWQKRLADERHGGGPDSVLLLTHPAVYTAGRRTQPTDVPGDDLEVIAVDRGGRITWHGPGQLVGYPIVKLAEPVDVVAWVRLLEQVLMAACDELGLPATGRVPGRSGVWLAAGAGRPERKIGAIGVRVARGITEHGFALNCDPDLSAFDSIVPCGIADAGVTSLTAELGRPVTVSDALPVVERALLAALGQELPITQRDLHADPVSPVRVLVDSR